MLRIREILDLLLVGFVGMAVFGAFLLIVLTNRICLVAQTLWNQDGMLQAPQRLNHRAYK